jgi:hypothetical protein
VVYSSCDISLGEGATMRQLRHALIVAAAAAVVLVVVARAESLTQPRTESIARARPTSPREDAGRSTVRAEIAAQRPVLFARVVKPFGASVRALPSSETAVLFNTRCGDTWPVLAVERGWVKVRTEAGAGWIGGSRVVVSSSPPAVDCSEARFIAPTGYASTFVPTGCLSLRSRPAADAPMLDCVNNGHVYAVLDGPFDPGSGDDWFRVSSPGTGTGWALAKHLYPI